MVSSLVVVLLPLLAALTVKAQASCNSTSPCGAANPCCSEFGFCGTGSFCLGGCNPLYSNTLNSCSPEPLCQNANHTFADNSRVLTNATYYNGNASLYDWIVDKGNVMNTNSSGGELAMLLTETNGGTRLSSTRYVHYGQITASIKTGRWGGVVTAFITMSDIKDEIDWEFPGNQTDQGQSNMFWQGNLPNTDQGSVAGNLTDTYNNYHAYTINWTPTVLTWAIDGNIVRTLKQSDTVDSAGVSHFPNTPSRIQLSLWPAGINTSAAGTVEWAGGMINWNDPDYVSAGHFYALVNAVSVTCADPTAPSSSDTSYILGTNTSANTPSVLLSNATTVTNGASSSMGAFNGRLNGAVGVLVGLMLALCIV